MDDFCGSPLWDSKRTWYTENPDLTVCFEKTVLVWIPCGFLWLFGGLDCYYSVTSRSKNVPWSVFNIAKLIIIALLCCLQILEVADYWTLEIAYPVGLYTPCLKFATFILAGLLLVYTKHRGIRSSAVQFMFWFLLLICEIPGFRTSILEIKPENKLSIFVLVTYFPLVIGEFILQCWADVAPEFTDNFNINERPCPEEESSFLSRLTFFWFEGLAWKGYRKPLEYTDLWDLNSEDKSKSQVPVFDKHWNKALAKAKMMPDSKASFDRKSGSVDFKPKGGSSSKPQASIFPTLCAAFGPTFVLGSILKLIHDLLVFVSPQVLRLLISFVSGNEENWKGYLYASILLITSCVQTLILSQYFHRMFIVGMRVRTTVISAIYRKALLISNAARKESTVGEIVNLMSVDAQRFMDLTTYLNMIWSAPLQIALSLYFLWGILGPSVLAGLAVMILMIPINAVIASKTKKYQIKQMKYKDQRVKLMNEILSGVKVLKLYAWEPSFADQINKIRAKEIKVLKDAAYMNAGTSFIWSCAPFLVALATFATYVLSDPKNVLTAENAFVSISLLNVIRMPMNMLTTVIALSIQVAVVSFATYVLSSDENQLDAQKAFVSLSLFNILRFPLSMLPMMISSLIQASVSMKRMNKYMNAEEIDPTAISHDAHERDPVVIENGNFSWEADAITLKNINLRIKDGSLVAIVGTVGSGKSSLLSAILGEMEKNTGRVNTKGSIAYVPQQAWIQNSTLRDNILFARPFEPAKYDKVIDSCALKPDLQILPAGDRTEIGEKGINLSGGQKQRVSLARAAYNNADTYLLDDPLSAVDSHVGKHIFENVLGPKGLLKRKTRILVTHGITYLPQMDNIIVMKDGQISETGTYKELLDKKGEFADFLIQHISSENEEDSSILIEDLEEIIGSKEDLNRLRQRSRVSESTEAGGDHSHSMQRQMSISSQTSGDKSLSPQRKLSKTIENGKAPPKTNVDANRLIEAEKAETGSVKFSVYLHYLKAVGWVMAFATLFMNLVFQGFSVGSNIWLSYWSNQNSGNKTVTPGETDMYLGVYGALGLGQALTALIGSFTLYYSALTAAKVLHESLLLNVLRSPMHFFDTTPLGRILNRFAKDVDVLDNTLTQIFRGWIHCFYGVIATITVISYSTPEFLAVVLPTSIIYYAVQRFYVATSRQLKRLESVSRSPIYSHFGETLTGASTIRAYSMQERFIHESEAKVDHNQIAYYPSIVSNRWLAVRLETIGNFIIFFAALFAVLGRETLSPGLVGLSVSYALQLTQTLNWLVRMTSDVETNIVAVERIKEYGETPREADWETEGRKPPAGWPEKGLVEFQHYQCRYREGLDLVLRDVTCRIEPGEKVGIVGRTGAGKSSLTLGLFRIVEAAGGSIIIDGQNIANLGLHDVRGRLTIIPQDPVLFSGTLRLNLDPFEKYPDDDIWRALELAHLKSFVKGLTAGLEYETSEGGENLSVGQRQLICLARALLRKTKILVLDEATAAVDLETDDLIQATIRTEFKDCTVLTIAHRLNTIMDSTRVMVLDKGEIREFDSPANLMKNKLSLFYSMAKDAGL